MPSTTSFFSKLYREGSFGVITKSGGLSNEIIWICSQFADGITTAIGIGGDAYPGTDYVSYLEMFENDPQTKAVVIVGEMGGDLGGACGRVVWREEAPG